MKARGWMLMSVGGGGGDVLDRLLRECAGDAPPAVAVDTDAVALSCRTTEILLLGEARLEGAGTAGDPVQGRLAAQDEEERVHRLLSSTRVLILLVTLGGGTGTGASPEILRLARGAGTATLCFATVPFEFESRQRREAAARAIPVLEEAADALVVIPGERLFHDSGLLPLPVALDRAARDLSQGILLVWRLMTRSGFVRMDMSTLRAWMIQGTGRRHFAYALSCDADRARDAVESLLDSPMLGGRQIIDQSRSMLVGVLGGEDLRMQEIAFVMQTLKTVCRPDCRIDLGTVCDPMYQGRLGVAILASDALFAAVDPEPDVTSPAAPGSPVEDLLTPSRRKRSGAGKLSFGATGRGRFNGIEPTVLDGQDLDIPTYQRRGIQLER